MLLFIAAQFVCTASVYSSCNGTSESWYPPENLKEKFRTFQDEKKHCQHFKTKRNIANISKQQHNNRGENAWRCGQTLTLMTAVGCR